MANFERYGTRDLIFSSWHRLLDHRFNYIDLDCVEYCNRCNQPLALIELGQDVGQQDKATTITVNLAKMASLPAYLVLYKIVTNKITDFRVQQRYPYQTTWQHWTAEQYINFLYELRDNHYCYQLSGGMSRNTVQILSKINS